MSISILEKKLAFIFFLLLSLSFFFVSTAEAAVTIKRGTFQSIWWQITGPASDCLKGINVISGGPTSSVDTQWQTPPSAPAPSGSVSLGPWNNPGVYDFTCTPAGFPPGVDTITVQDCPAYGEVWLGSACGPAPLTQCSDGIDNADPEDVLVDMADPGCTNAADNDERNLCSDLSDNDGDALTDMADPGCASPNDNDETNAPLTQCSDGIDNADPEDVLVDMADPGCTNAADNDERNLCSDLSDNDGDALTDMADPGCASPNDNDETNAPLTQCSDGIDNADPEDVLVDMADPGCTNAADNDERNLCSDLSDNDGDALTDMADPGCASPNDNDETNAPLTQCSDGIDNADPEDVLVDMADPGCTNAADNDERNLCSDLSDNDGDALTDMADPGCASPNDNDETNMVPTTDLTSEGLTVPGTGTVGSPLNFSATVRNSGTTVIGAFNDRFSYQWGGTGGAWTDLSNIPHAGLNAGLPAGDADSYTPLVTGNLYIQHCVDSLWQINEGANEWPNCTNNGGSPIVVGAPPVVSCTGLPGNASYYGGDDPGIAGNSSATHNAANTASKCEFICNTGFAWSGGICVAPQITQFEMCDLNTNNSCLTDKTVLPGTPVTVRWNSNTDSCAGSGPGFLAGGSPSGSDTVTASAVPEDLVTFDIICLLGSTPVSPAEITLRSSAVNPELTVSSVMVKINDPITLSWNTNNPLSGGEGVCTLSGGGQSIVVNLADGLTTGSIPNVIIKGRTTFRLTCPTGSTLKTVDIIPQNAET